MRAKANAISIIDKVISYEDGDMSPEEMVELFQELIDRGIVWKLQGFYGRTAEYLIKEGLCQPTEEGE